MKKYIPFPAYPDSAPLDISYIFEDEKPAGKHGFLTVNGDEFCFEDGTAVRFWGTNLNGGANFPEKPYAEKLAKRLAAYGCNIVRLHQMDSEWATPNIYQFTKGRRMKDTTTYDPESFDRLDYLIYCLKKEGIYVYLDMMTYRKFKEADGVRNSVALGDRAAPYCLFDEKLIELQKGYIRTLWEHENPYTGLKYKDDPVFALTDVVNEVCLFGCFGSPIVVEPYASEFREMFREWCKENAPALDVDAVDLNDRGVEPLVEYKIQIQERYYGGMIDYMRELGVKIPCTGPNFSWKYVQCKAAQHIGDFADSHLNVRFMNWSPGRRYSRDLSLHEQPEWGAMRNARMRRFGKPMFTSEWDLTFPNMYRAESPLLMAAVGQLQNWAGYTIHTYAYTSNLEHMHILGKEISGDTIGNVGYREGIFSTWNDPAKFGLFYHASLITRRGDVSPANNRIIVGVGELEQDNDQAPGESLSLPKKKAFIAATELSQIGVDYYGEFENTVPDDVPLVDIDRGEITSDTGEMYRSWEKKYGTIDTPMTKCAYGRLDAQGKITLDGMEITCKNDYAVIAASSLNNDLDISNSDSILITTVGRAENTGMKMSVAPEQTEEDLPPFMQMDDFGTAPIVCEVIEADIRIKNPRRNLIIWAVNAEGVFLGTVPVKYEDDGWFSFSLGDRCPTVYYLIQAE